MSVRVIRVWLGRILCAAGAMLLAVPALGQRYSFKHYDQEQGLANLTVICLLQDRTGFLWVGTQNGLFRYDGRGFLRYSTPEGLPSAVIYSLHETPDGTLWVGTALGLAHRTADRFVIDCWNKNLEVRGSAGIASDDAGRLFAGTSQGLLIGEPGTDAAFRWRTEMARAQVRAVAVDREQAIWFACGTGLCRMHSGRIEKFGEEIGLPGEQWGFVLIDSRGSVWVRSARRILELPSGAQRFIARERGLPPAGQLSPLYLDRAGRMLVPTDEGLALRTATGWDLIGKDRGLASNAVTCVLEDREGSLWIGMTGAGVARWLGRNQWENWTQADGLNSDVIWGISGDASGNVWIGTDLGLHCLLPGSSRWRCWTQHQGLGGNRVRAIAVDPGGDIWAGFYPGGLARLQPSTGAIRRLGAREGLTADYIYGLMVDADHRLWVSGVGGLFQSTPLDTSVRFHRQQIPGADPAETFYSCVTDRKGRVWASGSSGLAVRVDGRWIRFTDAEGLRSTWSGYLAVASDGSVWATYQEGLGVSRLEIIGDRLRVKHFSQKDGLPSDKVYFIGADARGWIWLGTERGVAIYDGKMWLHKHRAHGLVWDDCDANGFLADADGGVWIGTSRGLSHFHPRESALTVPPPSVVLTSATLGNVTQDIKAPAHVPYSHNSLLVSFAALTFRDESDTRYRYRLHGLEEDWIQTEQQQARYPKLPAGKYVFEVHALHRNAAWTSDIVRFPFEIAKPWWQTWRFRGVAAAMLVLGLWQIWRLRVRQLLRRQRWLEETVEQRTRELQEEKAELFSTREELRIQAMCDGLTGLLNRTAVFEALQQELDRAGRNGKSVAVGMVDLDHFKVINDHYGHQAGDAVLRETARRMRASVRSYDIIGRYGGEELLIIFPGSDAHAAKTEAERIRRAFESELFQVPDARIPVTCSVGVSSAHGPKTTPEDLVKIADTALYRAKHNGRNRVEIDVSGS